MRRNTGENPQESGDRQRRGQYGGRESQPPQRQQEHARHGGPPLQGTPQQQQLQQQQPQQQQPQQQQGRRGQYQQPQQQQSGFGSSQQGQPRHQAQDARGTDQGQYPGGGQSGFSTQYGQTQTGRGSQGQSGMGGQGMYPPSGGGQIQQSSMGGQGMQQQSQMGGQGLQQPEISGPKPVPVDNLVETDVVTAEPDDLISDVVEKMERESVGSVIVLEDDEPQGVITDRKIALSMPKFDNPSETEIRELLSGDLITGDSEMNVYEVLDTMAEGNIRRLPILDEDGSLTGIITLDDLLVFLETEFHKATEIIESQSPRL